MMLPEREIEQLRLLDRVGATFNRPAFWVDFGEIDPRAMSGLVVGGLAGRKRFRRYGGIAGERVATGYWITDKGRTVLSAAGG